MDVNKDFAFLDYFVTDLLPTTSVNPEDFYDFLLVISFAFELTPSRIPEARPIAARTCKVGARIGTWEANRYLRHLYIEFTSNVEF